MELPFGPHRLTSKRQVAIPAELMRKMHLEPGDTVYFQASEEHAGCILIVPAEVAAAWWSSGQRTSATS